MNKHFANVSHETSETVEPIYSVRLLPDVREALQEFAATQKQRPETIIAEAVRGYLGLGD